MDVSLLETTYASQPSVNFHIEFFIKVSHTGRQYPGYRYFISRSDADLLAHMYFNISFEELETSTIAGVLPHAHRARMAQNYCIARGVVENYRHLLLDSSRAPWPGNAPVEAIRAGGLDADSARCLLAAMCAIDEQSALDDKDWWVSTVRDEVMMLQTLSQTLLEAVHKKLEREYIAE